MVLGFAMVALEYPLPSVERWRIHRSIPLRVVLLILQSSFVVLLYQVGGMTTYRNIYER